MLFEENKEKITKNLNNYLIKEHFKMNSKTISEVNINFNIPNIENNSQNISFNNQNEKEEFVSFISEDSNIVIDITKYFACLNINYIKGIDFDGIIKIFNKIIEEIRTVREGIRLNRIGIRKLNLYVFKNLENINHYFEKYLFNFNELIQKDKISLKQQLETYEYNKYYIRHRYI